MFLRDYRWKSYHMAGILATAIGMDPSLEGTCSDCKSLMSWTRTMNRDTWLVTGKETVY